MKNLDFYSPEYRSEQFNKRRRLMCVNAWEAFEEFCRTVSRDKKEYKKERETMKLEINKRTIKDDLTKKYINK